MIRQKSEFSFILYLTLSHFDQAQQVVLLLDMFARPSSLSLLSLINYEFSGSASPNSLSGRIYKKFELRCAPFSQYIGLLSRLHRRRQDKRMSCAGCCALKLRQKKFAGIAPLMCFAPASILMYLCKRLWFCF